jgi:hypothetical protein
MVLNFSYKCQFICLFNFVLHLWDITSNFDPLKYCLLVDLQNILYTICNYINDLDISLSRYNTQWLLSLPIQTKQNNYPIISYQYRWLVKLRLLVKIYCVVLHK